ncbi:ribosome maturation factor RimP [Corynebacterium glutamicum]|uniref:ribosome maturation factor RimP n=1 Tax=Corynebacterium TaxID=1716 RepID=UPI0008062362|nr:MULTISPECIES: ribosome maturation factor RimP [Corynebacterium]ANR62852.1 ribosome maturation protein RimP [[Brevibacterium] flavum ZL-1]ANR65856.1 ribosome maturation protein RimP [Corynebacterium glutamicum ZL-6]ANU33966.1 ribosome maturation factor RimP [Corynebacterium glutamicum]APT07713.1 ribosome maturation factor RimP [Corynebacterium glutamicum]PST75536.1 ribosome maturation protein RimP [Corynebacterium glutamicum ZL-2]
MAFPTTEILSALIEPLAASHKFDLEGLKVAKAGPKSAVAIKVDSDSRPDLDQLEVFSQEIGELFDAAEQRGELNFGAGYTLEVSTPGVDNPLTLPRHWRRNRGRLVALDQDGRKRVARIGALNDAETHVVLIERNKKLLEVTTLELAHSPRAVVEIEFAKPAQDETALAESTFDEATA